LPKLSEMANRQKLWSLTLDDSTAVATGIGRL